MGWGAYHAASLIAFWLAAFGSPAAAVQPSTDPPVGPAQSTEEEDDYQGLPPGAGRDEVFGLCGACHSLKLVVQQGLSRSVWNEVIEYMVEEQEMPELDPEDSALILDYLERHYGPDRRALNRR